MNNHINLNNMFRILLAITLVFLTGCASNPVESRNQTLMPDSNKIWTTVGSDGIVDEDDTGKVFFDGSVVQLGQIPVIEDLVLTATQIGTSSAVIRYNVTPVDGLFGHEGIFLVLRYLVSGPDAQVHAKLIEVDKTSGVETTRLNFDSAAFPAFNNYQVQSVGTCTPTWQFDFISKAYYIEAKLIHSDIVGFSAAGIQMIKISGLSFC